MVNRVASVKVYNENQTDQNRRLAAGVVHEIRNPLTALKGFVKLLMQQGVNPTYLEIMEAELSRIEAIAEQYLAISKKEVTRKQRTDLVQLIKHVATLMEVQAKSGSDNYIIRLHTFEEAIWLVCGETEMKQVFMNVMKNAIEAMPEGGCLDIDVNKQEEEVRITVRDEGCGLSEEQLQRVGEPYFTTKERGTGLGLMMCRNLLDEHHGRLEIDSKLGEGTCVTIILPCH